MLVKNVMDLEIQLIYQENKDAFCGDIMTEVEVKLFTYEFSIDDTYTIFNNAHKFNPETEQLLTDRKSVV